MKPAPDNDLPPQNAARSRQAQPAFGIRYSAGGVVFM
jgi:hypothetical protein